MRTLNVSFFGYEFLLSHDWKTYFDCMRGISLSAQMGDQLRTTPSTPRYHSTVMLKGFQGRPQLHPHDVKNVQTEKSY